ncbi:unnamed protein product [Lasius platythorax]|uniref:DDE-1 domain-containing protein n=1 Tax=Lasius platythorax TaxID=488582 RepID=A0AAV2N2L6_9HYME
MKEYNISEFAYYKIINSADKINKLTQQITTLKRRKLNKYEDLEERLYKWFEERKESGDNLSQFDDEGLKLMDEFDGPSTSTKAKRNWLRACKKRFENLYQLKCRKTPNSAHNLAQESDQIEQPDEKFIRELINRLETEQIKRDNIYFMSKKTFTWRSLLSKMEKEIVIQHKLKADGLTTLFSANVTGSHKLTPFYYYEYKTQEYLKFLKLPVDLIYTSKKDTSKHRQIFTDWYNNHFMKFVRERQQEKNVSGKVFLLVYNRKFIHPEDIMQNDDFELCFPSISETCPLENFIKIVRNKFPEASKDFCRFYDMSIYIKAICESWTKISSTYIKSLLDKFLPDYRTKVNTTSTPLVKPTSNLIQNVTEEDTGLKVISAKSESKELLRFKQESPKRSIGEDREEEHSPPKILRIINEMNFRLESLTSYFDSYTEDEGKEQENDRNKVESLNFLKEMYYVMEKCVSLDNLTEFFDIFDQKFKGRECQQLESSGRTENIENIEENIESNPLDLDDKEMKNI